MRMNIKKLLFFPFLFIIIALKSENATSLLLPYSTFSIPKVCDTLTPVDSMNLRSYPYKWISYRAKTQFITQEAHDVVQIYIVNRIDSIIYFNASTSGVELARLVVTPTRATFVNKMQKSYFDGSHELLSIIFNFPVDFDMLQSLVNGKDFNGFVPCEEWQVIDEDKRLQLICSERKHQTLPLQIIQKLILDDSYQVTRHKIEVPEVKEIIDIEYFNYVPIGSYSLFETVKAQTSTITLDMEVKSVKFNVPGPTAIRIPEKFTPIQ